VAGKQMLAVLRTRHGFDRRVSRIVLLPLDLLPDGIYLLALYVSAAALAIWQAWKGSARAMLFAALAVPAVLLHVESALIASQYSVNYHSYLAFFSVFFVVSIAMSVLGWLADRVMPVTA
jgi:hypothetical protein